MHLPAPETPADPVAQRALDRARIRRALTVSMAFVLALLAIFSAQMSVDLRALMIAPHAVEGLLGIATAPLLHGSFEHVMANSISLLLLGTLAGSVYPRATLRALPLIWFVSGACAWLLGDAGSHHLGASGITHGLMFLVFVLGL
ncbi:MAG: rhomboid family intramembrane serine protease, partial [Pseudomonadota bacterium]|nr:rhomboid family intramembrane serine protease [Pseudomonadota bacterium]